MNAPDQIGAATIGYTSYSTITRLNRNKVFGRHTKRQVYKRLDRQTIIQTIRHTERQVCSRLDRQRDKYTDDWTDRETSIQTIIQTDKYTDD